MEPAAHRDPVSIGYLASVVGLVLVLPGISLAVLGNADWSSVFRWFVFWAVGVRLFTAGLRQIVKPSFTAKEIFRLRSADAEVVVRELGFANLCLGLAAIVAGFVPGWRMAAAFAGGLYFGIAGAMHIAKRPASPNEWIALISDVAIFGITAVCFVHQAL